MSGGRLVVLDRLGRDTKAFALAAGSASIGSDPSCDIRVILPDVRPLHATVTVHANRTLVRAVAGETLLNGAAVSVAALRHGDTLRLGGRALRWDYERPPPPAAAAATPCLAVPRRGAAARARRRSEPARRALHAPARDSAPASTSMCGKQVAIVQPQRRDTSERNIEPLTVEPSGPPSTPPTFTRKSFPSKSPRPLPLDDPTKASLWIESRKPRASPQSLVQSPRNSPRNVSKSSPTGSPRASRKRVSNVRTGSPKSVSDIHRVSAVVLRDVSPRIVTPRVSLRGSIKSAPLRLAVLKKAHSAQNRVTKIRAPLKIDHTKQAAIMLMTGHAARPRSAGPPASCGGPPSRPPSRRPGRMSAPAGPRSPPQCTPRRASSYRANTRDVRDSDIQAPVGERRSSRQTLQSPALGSPKKSALKDPTAKKNKRKTESIKFDLSNLSTMSNLDSYDQKTSSDVADSTEDLEKYMSDEDITLHYSDTSSTKSPSPMKTVHSRSSRIIEKSLGSPMQTPTFEKSKLTAESPRSKRSLRGSIMVQKALNNSDSRHSSKTIKSLSDASYSTTITSRISDALSHRSTQNLETFSIVDLVSIDSNGSGRSIYNSVDSNSTGSFGTPGTIRKTRSKNPSLLGSSTPYSKKTLSPKTDSFETTNHSAPKKSRKSTRRSVSTMTPENTQNNTVNSTRKSRLRSKSRINDSDVLFVNGDENEESSPRSLRRTSKSILSPIVGKNISIAVSASDSTTKGTITPENNHSPQDIGTPMLIIQNLLDQSLVSQTSKPSRNTRNSRRSNLRRKTTGSTFVEPKKSRLSVKSRSLNLTGRRSLRAKKTSLGSVNGKDRDTNKAGTPKSAVKLVQEAVKNKHSTAKKPQSKRSLIDNLDDSVFVKELFNSPVKRKLSQSMTEFSRKFFDDDDIMLSRPTRNTVALTGQTPDNSLLNNTQVLTPDMFVSPLSTPGHSPKISGLKRLFQRNTPDNDLRNVRGVKSLLRTPRARKSINNDLSNISGVKKIFGRSPRNRLSDVRVKEVFALVPTADLRRVSGVKALFQKSPLNDLRNISGVKRALEANTPRNNLSDVRGVKQLFREQDKDNNAESDVSGVEELQDSADATFDRLLDRPRLRAYTKSNSCGGVVKSKKRKSTRGARSLHDSIGLITENVEEWLENELKKRVQRPRLESDASKHTSRTNVTRELKKLHTDTVEGHTPPATSRSDDGRKRSAAELYSARKLPLKKRSLASPQRPREASLPLKKRALPHSTPLRPAARGLSMNVSELARVSPIAAIEPPISPPPPESPKPKAIRGRKPKIVIGDPKDVMEKPSPKRTRKVVPTLAQPRVTRGRKTNDSKAAGTNKNLTTVVIAKKPPVMSPDPSSKITRMRKVQNFSNNVNNAEKKKSPKLNSQIKITPKKTRAKVLKDTVVVRKPSPQVKLRSKRQTNERTEKIQMEKPKRTRNRTTGQNNIDKDKAIKTKKSTEVQKLELIEPRGKRGRKIAVETKVISEEDAPVRKRGRKAKEIQKVIEIPNKRIRNKTDSKKTEPSESKLEKKTRSKKENTVIRKTDQRNLAIVEPSPIKVNETKTVEKNIRKSKRGAKDTRDKINTGNTKKTVEKPRATKKSVAQISAVEPKTNVRKKRNVIAKEEIKPAKAITTGPARVLRKRPSQDPVEDTGVKTKKRRTRRAVV